MCTRCWGKQGLHIPVTDLFGERGQVLLAKAPLDGAYRARVNSLCRLIDVFDFEIDTFGRLVAGHLARDPGYLAILVIPGVGPTLAAIFVAEIGDVHRFPSARHLCSWAGLTPRHRESDTTVHRGPITKQGSTLVRWAAVEAAQKTPAWAGWLVRAAPVSPNAAAATSPPSRWPASCSPSSTTACAMGTSVPSTRAAGRRRERART